MNMAKMLLCVHLGFDIGFFAGALLITWHTINKEKEGKADEQLTDGD